MHLNFIRKSNLLLQLLIAIIFGRDGLVFLFSRVLCYFNIIAESMNYSVIKDNPPSFSDHDATRLVLPP